jgi:methylenetetrahydrofolate--tRNA-(uracil-5-)-methyltransferase
MTRGMNQPVHIVGGGLAGCEAAWQLCHRGVPVILHEMKPFKMSEAHSADGFAELVCSNSFRSNVTHHAAGLLKYELRRLGSLIMEAALASEVPAGSSLAVDRERFSAYVTEKIQSLDGLTIDRAEVTEIPAEGDWIIATGPLTSTALGEAIAQLCGSEHLYFYDAIAPIVDADTVDMDFAWRQSRYDKGDDYVNCPLDQAGYEAFIAALIAAPKMEMKAFEEARFFEGCLPIEVMAERGVETLRFGPMKPVGLVDPRTGAEPYAVVQLRMENVECTAYNLVGFQSRMKWPAQKEIFGAIPGLETASFLRFGSVHRNTFINGPALLDDQMRLRTEPRLRFAGQMTGVEGYIESTAVGLLAALSVAAQRAGDEAYQRPPDNTAFGALSRYVSGGLVQAKGYQPSNINWSLFPAVTERAGKSQRKQIRSRRGRAELETWIESQPVAATLAQPIEVVEDPLPPPSKFRRRRRKRSAS